MAKTKVISIEGIDGSGKSVQYRLLCEALRARGNSVATRDYPVYDAFFGSEVGRLLSGSGGVKATDVDGKNMALWYALDRWEDFKNYRDGDADYLVMNRFVLSNAVYQSIRDIDIGKPDIADWVFELEYEHFGLPRPAVNIFFDVAPCSAEQNVLKKGFRGYVGGGRDLYEESDSIQKRARDKYLECASRYDDILVVDCMENGELLPPESINRITMAELEARGIV